MPLFKRGNKLFVAVSSPTNTQALDEIKFATGLSTEAVLVQENQLTTFIEKASSAMDTGMDDMLDDDLENIDVGADEEETDAATASDADDAPVVKYVNKILLDAINKGASDIHFEPYEKALPDPLPHRRHPRRDRIATGFDFRQADRARQGHVAHGHFRAQGAAGWPYQAQAVEKKKRAIDFRVNTCPTLFGEKVVLRILDPSSAKLGIDALGYEPEQKELYLKALANPYGMILVTGPTGSGKTVSLYTGLNILNIPETNISTAEDPAEINLEGINQVNVNDKVGLTFRGSAQGLSASGSGRHHGG